LHCIIDYVSCICIKHGLCTVYIIAKRDVPNTQVHGSTDCKVQMLTDSRFHADFSVSNGKSRFVLLTVLLSSHAMKHITLSSINIGKGAGRRQVMLPKWLMAHGSWLTCSFPPAQALSHIPACRIPSYGYTATHKPHLPMPRGYAKDYPCRRLVLPRLACDGRFSSPAVELPGQIEFISPLCRKASRVALAWHIEKSTVL
jgi:hypothetical protein